MLPQENLDHVRVLLRPSETTTIFVGTGVYKTHRIVVSRSPFVLAVNPKGGWGAWAPMPPYAPPSPP